MASGTLGSYSSRTPWHLWPVGLAALLWNAYGGFHYVMTQTQNPGHIAAFTPEQRDYFAGFPLWMDAVWAVGVWGGVLGALLLLLKRRWAFPVFAVSLAAFLISIVYNYVLSDGARIMGPQGHVLQALITLICIGEALYSRALASRRVLR